ncbi:UDP-N-acetylmuramoyl-tripeptide--D-alanyl-D-alanine ligase, partial [Pseudomonas syringae pv. actinidifoliorum]|nr:UDP-N-acetylmuramoyl-tripeptide--D-alanyl-D-alanine ligase [Pseudomonas syringae pv. actinidifoliorum]
INAAVDILTGFTGRTVLVLGDIGELGEWAEQGHHDVGAYAAGKVSALYAVGPLMTHAVSAFGEHAYHFASQAELIAALGAEQDPNTTLLIKGSRSAAMENVVAALCGSSLEKH